jgi:predicted CopG family antitoxin
MKKTIRIPDDLYSKVEEKRLKNTTFSDYIRRLMEQDVGQNTSDILLNSSNNTTCRTNMSDNKMANTTIDRPTNTTKTVSINPINPTQDQIEQARRTIHRRCSTSSRW